MDEEYCLNRAEIFHGDIVATYCYYVGIHFLITGIYFAKHIKTMKGGCTVALTEAR